MRLHEKGLASRVEIRQLMARIREMQCYAASSAFQGLSEQARQQHMSDLERLTQDVRRYFEEAHAKVNDFVVRG